MLQLVTDLETLKLHARWLSARNGSLTCAETPLGWWILPRAQHLRLAVVLLRSPEESRRHLVPPSHGMSVRFCIPGTLTVTTENPDAQDIRNEDSDQAVHNRTLLCTILQGSEYQQQSYLHTVVFRALSSCSVVGGYRRFALLEATSCCETFGTT
jgi:hypothetical protein